MAERRRFSARRFWLAQLAVVVVGLGAFAFLATGLGSGGRAELTVTYTPDDGGPQVSERVVVEGVHCGDNGVYLTYRDAALGQAQVSVRNDMPSDQAREGSSANITLRFGEDLQFLSLEPFTSDAGGFRLEEHPGAVAFVGEEPWVAVSTDATVSGTFDC